MNLLTKLNKLIDTEKAVEAEKNKIAKNAKIRSIDLKTSPIQFGYYGIRIIITDQGDLFLKKNPQGNFNGNDIGYVKLEDLIKFRDQLNTFLEQTEI